MADAAEPLRVLHVSQPNAGGVAVYVGQAVADQRRRGWEVAVACPAGGDLPARCAAAGVPWFNWDAGRAPGPGTPLEALRLRRLVKGFQPDVVHLHSAKAGLAGRLLRRPAGVPAIFQPHGWSRPAGSGSGTRPAAPTRSSASARGSCGPGCGPGSAARSGSSATGWTGAGSGPPTRPRGSPRGPGWDCPPPRRSRCASAG
ncbi:glycosyltransferase [Actinomadura physcomitrii]|uniref:glycosyltransferase n=1 Tax=Actinomadura physcomitrii TaxID=2650748 RepID=UPI001F2E0426|nr:glycosyltransferase [Actinomadura physcomitrii]